LIILGVYLNQENPSVLELARYHEEMTMGFATLVENKDGSTGGHIKRTTMYVRLLAEELRRRGYYKEMLTKDYVRNLYLAAPMHDIGKVAVPDVILQKPGRLTEEEFAQMKLHAEHGGRIVQGSSGVRYVPNRGTIIILR
jgi:HD-GYP domain-containing protein (c-di-GMP phosphodiesterase class II)